MALSARELFLIVRAQNQASGTLHKVAADMAALGKKEAIRRQQGALDLQKARINNQIMTKQAALRKLNADAGLNGEKERLANIQKGQKLMGSINRNAAMQLQNEANRERITKKIASNEVSRQRAVQRLSQISRGTKQSEYFGDPQKLRDQIKSIDQARPILEKQLTASKGLFTAMSYNMSGLMTQAQQLTHADQAVANSSVDVAEKRAKLNRELRIHEQELGQVAQKQRDLNQATKAFKTERIGQATHLLGSMGRQLQLVGFGGAAALGFAAASAANLSTQVTLATTQYKNNVAQIKQASDVNFGAIIKDMQQFPASADDMAKSLYDIFSTLNVNGRQGRDILYQVNKAAVAGQLSVQDATQGVLSVLSNFKEIGQNAKGTEGALNRMFAAVRFGRVTMQQFAVSLQTTAPAANQTGQTFDNLAGSVAFLSRSLGISKASVGYARLLQQLTSTKMVEGLKKHGISVRDAAGHYKQLDVIMGEINQKFPTLAKGQQSAQNFFKDLSGNTGTVQASRAFTSIITNMSGYRDILGKTTKDNNEFQKSFDALNQTAGVQFGKALNVLKSLWLELGRAAIPTIAKLFKPIGELADKISSLDKPTQDAIGRIVALGVAIVGITGIVLSVGSALGGAILIFESLGGGTLLALTAGFIALGAAIYLIITNWDKIQPKLQAALPTIEAAIKGAVSGIATLLRGVSGVIVGFIGLIDAALRGDWGDAWTAAGKAVKSFGTVVGVALQAVESILQGWLDFVTSGVTGFVVGMTAAGVAVSKLITSLKELEAAYRLVAISGAAASAASTTGGRGAGIGAFVGDMVTNARLAGMEFTRLRGTGVGTFRSLAGAAALLGVELGPGGLLVVGIAAVAAAFIGLRAIFGGHVGQQNAFLQQQDQMVQKAHQVTTAIQGEIQALNGLADAAKGVSNASLDRAQAQLNVVTSRRALTQGIAEAKASGGISTDERLGIKQLRIDWERAKGAAQDASKAFADAKAHLTALRGRASQALAQTPGDIAQQEATLLARQRRLTSFITTATPATSYQDLKNAKTALDQVNKSLGNLSAQSQKLQVAKGAISDYIKAVAPKATTDQVQALTDKMVALQQVLTPKQIKILINSGALDDATKKAHNASKAIQDIGKHQRKIKLNVDTSGLQGAAGSIQKFQQHHAMGAGPAAQITADPSKAVQAAKTAGNALDKVGHKVVHPKINAQFKPDAGTIAGTATTLGAAAKTGVLTGAAGLGAELGAQMSHDVLAAIAQGKAAAQATSPSKKTKKEIGIPLAQGIIKGFSEHMKKNWAHTAESVQRLIIKGLDFSGQSKKEIAKTISDAYGQAMDTATQALQAKWDEIHDLNVQNFGELFQGAGIALKLDWGQKLNIGDLQKDLDKQLGAFRRFNAGLNALRRRGAPQSLIDQLRQLGPAAQVEIDALTHATKGQLRKYEQTWKQSQRNINKATKQQFKQQVKEWKSQGKAIAAGILMGLRSGQPALEKYFRHIWMSMIAATKKHNKSHSPSKLYAEEGLNIMEGLRLGLERGARGLAVPGPGVGPAWGGRGREGRAGGGTVIYQTVNAHYSESLSTTLRKANFRLKHRNT